MADRVQSLADGLSLGSFRGASTFLAMYLGAAVGIRASHLPGFPLQAGVASVVLISRAKAPARKHEGVRVPEPSAS